MTSCVSGSRQNPLISIPGTKHRMRQNTTPKTRRGVEEIQGSFTLTDKFLKRFKWRAFSLRLSGIGGWHARSSVRNRLKNQCLDLRLVPVRLSGWRVRQSRDQHLTATLDDREVLQNPGNRPLAWLALKRPLCMVKILHGIH